MSEIITCPTGLTGRIRWMKVREERILADRKLAKAGEKSATSFTKMVPFAGAPVGFGVNYGYTRFVVGRQAIKFFDS